MAQCKISREGAKLFASSIMEDALVHAEIYATEFAAFVASNSKKKSRLEYLQNVETPCNRQGKNLTAVQT